MHARACLIEIHCLKQASSRPPPSFRRGDGGDPGTADSCYGRSASGGPDRTMKLFHSRLHPGACVHAKLASSRGLWRGLMQPRIRHVFIGYVQYRSRDIHSRAGATCTAALKVVREATIHQAWRRMREECEGDAAL
jgi:hypothetical protein